MPSLRASLLIAAFLLACLFAGCVSSSTRPPECHLPPRTAESSPRFVLPTKAYYLQRDPRWAAEPIGGSGKPLGHVGCTLCCVSMALAQYHVSMPPADLNRALKQVDGFTAKGWVRWAAVAKIAGGRAHIEIPRHPTHRDIIDALAYGHPVLVKVAPPGMIQHWVLLVGRDGQELLMKDPLNEKRSLQPLSTFASPILALRVLKPGPTPAL